jgi:hypothetical protein
MGISFISFHIYILILACFRKIFGAKSAAATSSPVRGTSLDKLLAKGAAKKKARGKTAAATATASAATGAPATTSAATGLSTSTADDGESTTLAGSSSPGPETVSKARREANKGKRVLSESKPDDDEQEAKKSKSKKKKRDLRESNLDDKETDKQGPSNQGTDDNETDDKIRLMTSKRRRSANARNGYHSSSSSGSGDN